MVETVLTERDGPITRLVLNRPKRGNAFNVDLVEALLTQVDAAYADGTRLLVFTGAGDRFSSGFDLSGLKEQSAGDLALRFIRLEMLLQAVYHANFDTMAMAHGQVFGAACDLIAVCNHRIAAPGSNFRMPGLKFGVVLGTRRLAQCIGKDAARTVLGESKILDAAEAKSVGLITAVAEQETWKDLVVAAGRVATVLSPDAAADLNRATLIDTRAEDMYLLVQSVARPGFKERVTEYLAAVKAASRP